MTLICVLWRWFMAGATAQCSIPQRKTLFRVFPFNSSITIANAPFGKCWNNFSTLTVTKRQSLGKHLLMFPISQWRWQFEFKIKFGKMELNIFECALFETGILIIEFPCNLNLTRLNKHFAIRNGMMRWQWWWCQWFCLWMACRKYNTVAITEVTGEKKYNKMTRIHTHRQTDRQWNRQTDRHSLHSDLGIRFLIVIFIDDLITPNVENELILYEIKYNGRHSICYLLQLDYDRPWFFLCFYWTPFILQSFSLSVPSLWIILSLHLPIIF